MSEIRFKVRNWDEDAVATRVVDVIAGHEASKICPPFKKDSGYRWQLDASNDWWMDIDRETGEYILAYRYGQEDTLKAIKIVLEWIFK